MASEPLRRELWERDDGICGLCGKPADPSRFHLDHIVPDARGGLRHPDNLRVTHPRCNQSRGLGEYRDVGLPTVTTTVRMTEQMLDLVRRVAQEEERPLNTQLVRFIRTGLEQYLTEHPEIREEADRGE